MHFPPPLSTLISSLIPKICMFRLIVTCLVKCPVCIIATIKCKVSKLMGGLMVNSERIWHPIFGIIPGVTYSVVFNRPRLCSCCTTSRAWSWWKDSPEYTSKWIPNRWERCQKSQAAGCIYFAACPFSPSVSLHVSSVQLLVPCKRVGTRPPWSPGIFATAPQRRSHSAPAGWRSLWRPVSFPRCSLPPCSPSHKPARQTQHNGLTFGALCDSCVFIWTYKLTSKRCCKGFCISFSWQPNWSNPAPSKPGIQNVTKIYYYYRITIILPVLLYYTLTCSLTKLHPPVPQVVHSNNFVS